MNVFINKEANSSILQFAQDELMHYLMQLDPSCNFVTSENSFSSRPYIITLQVQSHISSLKAPEDPFTDDQYLIQVDKEKTVLIGSNSRSVLLAVYRMLTELGCRFLGPGRNNEWIPQISFANVKFEICESAYVRHRGVCIEGADSTENILDFIDWLPKSGFNSIFLQHEEPYAFLQRWYTHMLNPLLQAADLTESEKAQAYQLIEEAISVRGLLQHRMGHGWTSNAVQFNRPCEVAPAQLLKKAQPLLAKVNGKRSFIREIPSNTNLCYSSASAVQAFITAVLTYVKKHPLVDYLHIWLADEHNNVCECDECKKTTLSDQYIVLLNTIDEELTKINSSLKIVLLLYQELLWPPAFAEIKNQSRFVMMFAPISRTFERSYCSRRNLPPLPAYHRNQIQLPKSLEENLIFLEAWKKQYPVLDSFDYDYPLGRAHYGDLGYLLIAQIIYEDIKALPDLKLNGYISCQEFRAAFPNSFPNYVMGKMLWKKECDFDALKQEYFQAAYGRSYTTALKHLEKLSSLSSPDYFNGHGSRISKDRSRDCKAILQHLERFKACISNIIEEEKGVHQIYWDRLDYHTAYCIMLSTALVKLAEGNSTSASFAAFLDLIRSNELKYQSCLDVYRIIEVSTKYTGFSLDEL